MPTTLRRLAFSLSLFLLLPSLARAETVLRLNEIAADSGAESVALHGFKAEVESATKGAVRVDLHFAASLGNPSASVENMMSGDLDLFSSDLRFYLPLMIDEITGLDLPFMVPSNRAARRYIGSSLFDDGRKKVLDLRGVRFLELDAFGGPHRMMASLRPISTIDDLKGLKLAIFPSSTKAGIQLWGALGATVVDEMWTDVPAALRQHRLDGVIAPDLSSLLRNNVLNVARYVGSARDHPQVWQISINEALWRKIDAGQQAALSKAAADAASIYNDVVAKQFKADSASLAAAGIAGSVTLNAVSAHQWLLPAYDQLIDAGATTKRIEDTAGAAISSTTTQR